MLKKSVTFQSEEAKKMRAMILPMSAVYERSNKVISFAESKIKIWTLAAFTGSFFGLTVGLTGLFFSFLAYFEPSEIHSRLGGFLLIAVLPFFVLAAHALDKIDSARRMAKVERLKKNREIGSRFQQIKN
jgi:hypothetical protein